MAQAPISGSPVDVPPTRRLRQPWPQHQEELRRREKLAEEAAAEFAEAIGKDLVDEFIAAMVAGIVASRMDARLLASRTSSLQRFERRLHKSVDTFNRQFG